MNAVADIVKEASDALAFVDLVSVYDDQFDKDQIAELLADHDGPAMERFHDWVSEAREEGVRYCLSELPDEMRDRIDAVDAWDAVREMLWERDTSTPFDDLLAQTRSMLFCYLIGDPDANADEPDLERCWHPNDEPEVAEAQAAGLRDITAGVGLDPVVNAAVIDGIVAENVYHGGVVAVLWWGRPASLVEAVQAEVPPTVIEFTDPQVLVWNGWAGAGWFDQFTGTARVPWDTGRLRVDGVHWSVDNCFGLYLPGMAGDPKLNNNREVVSV